MEEFISDPLGIYIIPSNEYESVVKEIMLKIPDIQFQNSNVNNLVDYPKYDDAIKEYQNKYIIYFQNSIYILDVMIGDGFLITKMNKLMQGPEYNSYPFIKKPGLNNSPGFTPEKWYEGRKKLLDKYHNNNTFEDVILEILKKHDIRKEKSRKDFQ